jgi:hypothetical protein
VRYLCRCQRPKGMFGMCESMTDGRGSEIVSATHLDIPGHGAVSGERGWPFITRVATWCLLVVGFGERRYALCGCIYIRSTRFASDRRTAYVCTSR